MKIIYKLGRWLIRIGIKYIWAYVDKNKDGKISLEELDIVYKDVKNLLKRLKLMKKQTKQYRCLDTEMYWEY